MDSPPERSKPRSSSAKSSATSTCPASPSRLSDDSTFPSPPPSRPRRPRSQSLCNAHTGIAVTEVPRRMGQPPCRCTLGHGTQRIVEHREPVAEQQALHHVQHARIAYRLHGEQRWAHERHGRRHAGLRLRSRGRLPVRLKLSGLEQRLGDDHERLGRARLLRLGYLFSGRQLEPRLYCKLTTGRSGQFLDGDADKWTDAASSFLYDQWVDLGVHVKWTASGSGIFDVYKNGARVYSLIGVRTLPSVAGTYQELMNYHAPTQNTIIEYAGGLAVGPSYASVDPATH